VGATVAQDGNALRPVQPGRSTLVTTHLYRPSSCTLGLPRLASVTSGIVHRPTQQTQGTLFVGQQRN